MNDCDKTKIIRRKVFLGEPCSWLLVKPEEEGYAPSLEGHIYECILKDPYGTIVRSWSTQAGTINYGTTTYQEQEVGYAGATLTGTDTAELSPGDYTIEISEVISADGRAIARLNGILEFVDNSLKNGIEE